MILLDAKQILEEHFARSLGLDKYEMIMRLASSTDVSHDPGFQRAFNAFYRIRRNAEWRKCYYDLFEQAKEKHYGFEEVIRFLFDKTGNVESSFSSKMIATIDPDKPIWDQYVIQNLGLELKGKAPQERVENAIGVYESIEQWFAVYLKTEEAHENRRPRISIDATNTMQPAAFEQLVAALFNKMGYDAKTTKLSGDQGVDVVAEKKGRRVVIQAKCYQGSVGNSAVQEVVAGKQFYHANEAFVVTNSVFTKSAIELARANNVELWDRSVLAQMLDRYYVYYSDLVVS